MNPILEAKYIQLINLFKMQGKIAVAYSGGVDSTLLLNLAKEAVGNGAIAVTILSEFFPSWEIEYSRDTAKALGVDHKFIEISPLAIDEIKRNPPDRCYTCKKTAFTLLKDFAAGHKIPYICEGSCTDDLGDYRPGFLAVKELEINSPFIDFDFSKKDIVELSKILGIPGWDRPSCACLASRIPYNEDITHSKLSLVEESEEFLHTFDIPEARVRLHNGMARIEVFEPNIQIVIKNKDVISRHIKSLGAKFVAVELEGYKTGSMNKELDESKTAGNDEE